MQGYNSRYKTNFADVREWITAIYRERSGAINAKRLGVSSMTFYSKIYALGISPYKQGPRRRVDLLYKDLLLLAKEAKDLMAKPETSLAEYSFYNGINEAYADAAKRLKLVISPEKEP